MSEKIFCEYCEAQIDADCTVCPQCNAVLSKNKQLKDKIDAEKLENERKQSEIERNRTEAEENREATKSLGKISRAADAVFRFLSGGTSFLKTIKFGCGSIVLLFVVAALAGIAYRIVHWF